MILCKKLRNSEFKYQLTEDGYILIEYHGQDSVIEVPSEVEGVAVVGIEKKVFLSKKNLRVITLPNKLDWIGDWGFGYCSNLNKVMLPARKIYFGKSTF